MNFTKNKYVVIEFDNERFKIVQFVSTGSKKILNVAVQDIVDWSEEKISEAIVKIISDWKARSNKVYVSISRQQITTRNLKLPSNDPKEINEMLNLQLNKLTPYSREEITIDFHAIDVELQGYTKIFLVIIHRDIINRILKIMKLSAMWPEGFYLSSEGIVLNYFVRRSARKEKNPIGIIDIDYRWSDFVVAKEENLLFSRNLNIGRINLDQEGDIRFINELKKLLNVYQNSDIDVDIKKLILTGASGDLSELGNLIQKELNLNVEFYPSTIDDLEPDFSPEKTKLGHLHKLLPFSSIFGLGCSFSLVKLNLIPAEIKLQKKLIARGKEVMTMGVLIFFILIISMGVLFENIYYKKKNFQFLIEQDKSQSFKVNEIEKKLIQVGIIRNRIDARFSVLNILTEIYKNIPSNLFLSAINFDNQKGIVLRGYSQDASNIFTFVSQMEASLFFNQVKTTYMTKKMVGNMERTDFELTSFLESGITPREGKKQVTVQKEKF